MATKRVADIVREATEQIITDLGYELVEVEYLKKFDGMNLTMYIYKPVSEGGIKIEDCETVSRTIDPLLDEIDPTHGESYRLNVSSMGLDRPLKNNRDFERAIGNEIEVKLFAPLENKKSYIGILTETTDTYVVLQGESEKYQIEKEKIAAALPVIKF